MIAVAVVLPSALVNVTFVPAPKEMSRRSIASLTPSEPTLIDAKV